MKEIPDKSVDLILTDPPYGINFIPQRQNSKKRLGDTAILNDELIGEDWAEWFTPIGKEIYRVLKDNSVAYFFSGFNPYYYYYYSLNNCGFVIKANLIWVKNNFGIGYHFRRQYEQCLVGFKGNPPVPKQAYSDVIFEERVNATAMLHSCQKPIDLIKRLIPQYTTDTQTILDPFSGSGTTAIACLELNRNFICIEKDPKYYELSVKRVEDYKAQLKMEFA